MSSDLLVRTFTGRVAQCVPSRGHVPVGREGSPSSLKGHGASNPRLSRRVKQSL